MLPNGAKITKKNNYFGGDILATIQWYLKYKIHNVGSVLKYPNTE